VFIIDSVIWTYIQIIVAKQKGWWKFFSFSHSLLLFSTLMLQIDFGCYFIFYTQKIHFPWVLWVFWAIWLILVSWKLTNFIKVLWMTMSYIIDISFLLILIIFIFAFIGRNFLEPIEDEVIWMETDYKSFDNAVINTFFMTTYSNYPTTAIPYFREQNLNAFMFFVPLILFIITIIEPIPVAVLFDRFRVN